MATELEALETLQVRPPILRAAGVELHQELDSRPGHGGGGGGGGRHGDAGAWGPQRRWPLLEGGLGSKLRFAIKQQ